MRNRVIQIIVLTFFIFSAFSQTNRNEKLNVKKSDYSFVRSYVLSLLPHIDSTNFDNHKAVKFLTKRQIELLKLDKVFRKEYIDFDQSKIGINYILNLSENYTTIVIFFYFSEMELSSTLINYDKEFDIIDFKTVAMDEIAESIFRTESLIEKNKITITNFKFFNETIHEKVFIEILDDGKLKTRH